MKKILLLATALAALAGCTESEFVGDQQLVDKVKEQGAIAFGFDIPMTTRAEGKDAATALGNQFIVYGEKGSITNAAPTDGNLVFPNYQVNYADNTAYTTTSNTKGWEYVGLTHSSNYQNNIKRKATSDATPINASDAVQTIKYWDYGAANYIFTAVSANQKDITNGRVTIQKNEFGTTAYDKGYTITLAKSGTEGSYVYPTLNKLYFADREVIAKGDTPGADRTAVNAFGGNVTLTFRNLVSQIRTGVYETIPGYAVTEIKFYVNNNESTPTQTEEAKVSTISAFGAVCPNNKTANFEGTINVVYFSNSDGAVVENLPKVTVTPNVDAATNLILGTNMSTISTTGTPLATSASSPTWDTSGGAYTEVLPQIGNTTNLKLKVDYKLWNSISGETINVTGATAEIPSQYLQWKPNYMYTYLFKISNGGNGHTGTTGPEGLYPITFDAVEIVAEDGKAEYITTVSEPSITTFGVKNGKYTTGKNEYETGTDIYATIMASNAIVDPSAEGHGYFVYTATGSDITEASVAEAIAEKAIGRVTTPAITIGSYSTDVSLVNSNIPAENGTTFSLTSGKVIKMANVSTEGYYVVAYKATAGSATATDDNYDETKTYYSTTADPTTGFYPLATPTSEEIVTWDSYKSKFTTAPTQPVYVYKVIKVEAVP